jgi:trk system potassium uptake protein TrkA
MRIIVIGAGELGQLVATKLSALQHDVTVVDMIPDGLARIRGTLDAMLLEGEGTNVNTLKKAGAESADILLALSGDEAANILACQIAKKLGTAQTLCRIYSSSIFSAEDGITPEYFGIDKAFSSVEETVEIIQNVLHSHILHEQIAFSNPDARIAIVSVPLNSEISNVPVRELPCQDLLKKIRIAALVRDNSLVVPHGDTELQPGDRIYISGRSEDVEAFVSWLSNKANDPVRRIVIAGLTPASLRLIDYLVKHDLDVRVVESEQNRAEHALTSLPKGVAVIQGDPTNADILDEADVSGCDAFVAMTEKDENNILACLLASRIGSKKTIALTGKPEYIGILPALEQRGCWFNSTQIAANAIFRLMAGETVRVDSELQKLNARLVELHLTSRSNYVGKSIIECEFPAGLLLALILREDYVIAPTGSTILHPNDTLVVIADTAVIRKVKAFL